MKKQLALIESFLRRSASATVLVIISLLVGSVAFWTPLGTSRVVFAADTLVDWNSVRSTVESLSTSGSPGKSSRAPAQVDLNALKSILPQPAHSAGGAASGVRTVGPRASTGPSPALFGLSTSVVPAVTGDLFEDRRRIGIRAAGGSLGRVSALRLYRPPVGASVGSLTPSFVGQK